MSNWLELLRTLKPFADLVVDTRLVAAMAASARATPPPLQLFTPADQHAPCSELVSYQKSAWPAISVTGGHCELRCDHCRGQVLQHMIAATKPDMLWQIASKLIADGAKGLMLTGGSDRRHQIDYTPFLPVLTRLKTTYPQFKLAVHTALIDRPSAHALAQAGVDMAMLDLIGAQDTISQVYHLRRTVANFETTLAHLLETPMQVVPHIVVGLHYGHLLGEWRALEMVTSHRPHALVLVVAMPYYAPNARPFRIPDSHAVGNFFREARSTLTDLPIYLGCGRPAGTPRRLLDSYAVMAGLDGIAHPAEGIVELAQSMGRQTQYAATCSASASAPWTWATPDPALFPSLLATTRCTKTTA